MNDDLAAARLGPDRVEHLVRFAGAVPGVGLDVAVDAACALERAGGGHYIGCRGVTLTPPSPM